MSVLYYTRNNKQCKNTYFSLINTNLIIASVAGKLYESTQSYMSALIMLLVLILAGAVVFFGIRRPKAE
ncbi:hypothetical protein [Eubacterium ramulus]